MTAGLPDRGAWERARTAERLKPASLSQLVNYIMAKGITPVAGAPDDPSCVKSTYDILLG
jgi:hypothetical protein